MTHQSQLNYVRSREIVSRVDWERYGAQQAAMRQYFRAAVTAPRDGFARRMFGHAMALKDGLFEEAAEVRSIYRPIEDFFNERGHFQSVFDVATWITLTDLELWQEGGGSYFRGQAQAWPVVPTIFREVDSEAVLERRLRRLACAVAAIRRNRPDLTEAQATAVAQHYSSKENGIRTWLLDVTRCPLTALVFASKDGVPGSRGIIWAVLEDEWTELSGHGSNRLGRLTTVDVEGIHRIQAQKGLFIDTSHPQLFEAYSPDALEFDQVDGLVFEDRAVDPPLTVETLLQEDDQLDEVIRGADPNVSDHPTSFSLERHQHSLCPLSVADFRNIVASWLRIEPELAREGFSSLKLGQLCDFHSRVFFHPRDRLTREARVEFSYLATLRTLRIMVSYLSRFPEAPIVEPYLDSVGLPSVRELLDQFCKEAESADPLVV